MRGWKGETFGMAVPGFINPSDPSIRVDRPDGDALREAFQAFADARTRVVLLERLTDWEECAGYYRSPSWSAPEQYLTIVREGAERLNLARADLT